jgi:hypothetical protein
MKMTYISCITAEWELPTVVINGPLVCPNTSGVLHTSSCNQGSTATHKRPLYMTVSLTDLHYTDNHSLHCCDMLHPAANRVASQAVMSHKRRGIPSTQALHCSSNTWRHISVMYSSGWENGGSPSMFRRVRLCSSLRPIGISQNPDQFSFWGASPLGWFCPLSGGDPWYTASYLVESYRLVEKESGIETGSAGNSPNRRSSFFIRNGVLLYKQRIRPMMDYSCPVWKSAAHCHIRKLQVLQSMCLCIAINATWHIGNQQIHEDLGVPFFTEHVRSLSERFNFSKLADAGNPLVMQLGSWPSVDLSSLKQGNRDRQLVLATCKRRPCQYTELFSTGTFQLPWLRLFPYFFPRL